MKPHPGRRGARVALVALSAVFVLGGCTVMPTGPTVMALPGSSKTVEQYQAIVCMVGDNIGSTRGIAGRVFQALNGTNIRMISQGASNLNLSFVVAGRDLTHAVEMLHHAFFSDLDPAVFDPKRSAA